MKREDVTKLFPDATDEQVNTLLDIHSKDIGNAKRQLEVERDNYKDSLALAQKSLKEFEGVDVKELQGKVTKLTADLTDKDKEYQQKISDMEFAAALDSALGESKARSLPAVKALLDIETLKASKNRTEDIRAAIAKVKADNDYLFISDEPIKNAVANTGSTGTSGKKMTLLEAMKYKNEHPDADIKSLIGQTTGKE